MRLIDADALIKGGWHLVRTGISNQLLAVMSLADVPTVDIKTEVAREIFAEIKKLISENLREAEDSYHRMRVKGRNATFYEGSKQSLESLSSYIAELENKYIGGVG